MRQRERNRTRINFAPRGPRERAKGLPLRSARFLRRFTEIVLDIKRESHIYITDPRILTSSFHSIPFIASSHDETMFYSALCLKACFCNCNFVVTAALEISREDTMVYLQRNTRFFSFQSFSPPYSLLENHEIILLSVSNRP